MQYDKGNKFKVKKFEKRKTSIKRRACLFMIIVT